MLGRSGLPPLFRSVPIHTLVELTSVSNMGLKETSKSGNSNEDVYELDACLKRTRQSVKWDLILHTRKSSCFLRNGDKGMLEDMGQRAEISKEQTDPQKHTKNLSMHKEPHTLRERRRDCTAHFKRSRKISFEKKKPPSIYSPGNGPVYAHTFLHRRRNNLSARTRAGIRTNSCRPPPYPVFRQRTSSAA